MTKAHIHVAGFEPIIRLLPKRLTSAILVQCLAEGWWDITHTFTTGLALGVTVLP